MKKIIPYIASNYKKDKIWLRRTKPNKRQYQVLISLDDSRSMRDSQSIALAFDTMALCAKALTLLEVGELGFMLFGQDSRIIHPLDKPFTSESGESMLREFTFAQERTDIRQLLHTTIDTFSAARSSSTDGLWQIQFIISDGLCDDHDALRLLLRQARELRIFVVFVILDSLQVHRERDGTGKPASIVDLQRVKYDVDDTGKTHIQMERYLSTFPFDYYVIVRHTHDLPTVLSRILSQFFGMERN